MERAVRFHQDLLGFPLIELIENRDYPGSSHFFFDIGNNNLLAYFDFPGLAVGPYAEVLGLLHRPRRGPHGADRRPARRDVRRDGAVTRRTTTTRGAPD